MVWLTGAWACRYAHRSLTPGWVIFSGRGGKIANWDSMPETIRKEVAENYPIYSEPPPLDDTRPNETSWTYFKKQIDAKRAKEPAKKEEKE